MTVNDLATSLDSSQKADATSKVFDKSPTRLFANDSPMYRIIKTAADARPYRTNLTNYRNGKRRYLYRRSRFSLPRLFYGTASLRASSRPPKYEILQCGDVEKLIKKRTHPEESPLYYVTIEDTFDVIKRAHIATGHGGRDRMIKELQRKYANITTKALEHFKSLCAECQKKRKRPMTKGIVVRPILTKEFACRGQVDLIDMQAIAHSNYKWIMVYQDHLTKFCVIRPLTTKRASEVAFQLMDIFRLMGAPVILRSDNGSEFTSHVITELKEVWPTLKLVHGKPRHPHIQGSV
ncbi:KRAB-A domain-containing protein 2-like [Mya arenaria]|uniref:KRAB-A domain-containing protein 2-like n=1 Tax=Mya arenaria TaxID=6604 RepID=UPI0022E02FCD|nr:KRAB-A domain-containing protein 2-like [Mya arenaria]